jgi:hypothetical protein
MGKGVEWGDDGSGKETVMKHEQENWRKEWKWEYNEVMMGKDRKNWRQNYNISRETEGI